MSIAAASDLELSPAPARPLLAPLLLAAAGVALADWLFYGWDVGISLALFLGLLGIAGVAGNRVQATRKTTIIMAVVFVAGLAAVIEDVNLLSVIVSTLATALFVNIVTAREATSWQRNLLEAVTVPLRGPFRLAARSVRRAPLHEGIDAGMAGLAGRLDRAAEHLRGLPDPVVVRESADRTSLDADRSARALRPSRSFANAVLDPDRLHHLATDPSPHQTEAGAAIRTRRRRRRCHRSRTICLACRPCRAR